MTTMGVTQKSQHKKHNMLLAMPIISLAFAIYAPKLESTEIGLLLESPLKESYRIVGIFGQQEVDLSLQAILNQKAFIQDKWYGIGDKIGTFYIYKITNNEVILVDKKSQQKMLRLKKNKKL